MTTPLCIPLTIGDAPGAIARMQQTLRAGATMIEMRSDQATAETITTCLSTRPALPDGGAIPAIVTIRPTWEGGAYAGDEARRLDLFHSAVKAGANYIDVEWVAWQQTPDFRRILPPLCQAYGCKLILSNHDFAGRPADLEQRLAAMAAVAEAAVLKLVWKADSVVDAALALRLTREHTARNPRPLLALAMGEFGQLSRLLGAKFAHPFTFATLPQDQGTAPGQPSIFDLLITYRWAAQRLDSQVFGVAGWPVGHSMSPAIHNAGLTAVGGNAIYVPIPIAPAYEQFAAAVDALRACPDMHLGGLSVTIPHKENALRYVGEHGGSVDELSRHIGVINTIVFRPDGTLYGLNSDYAGALDALVDAMGLTRPELAGRQVAVLGAGGAARAIVAGLAACRASVVIYARNVARAQALAADFAGPDGLVTAAPLDSLRQSTCQIVINATPLGMYPHVQGCPVDFDPPWDRQTTVFDTVYNPLHTQLLQLATRKGARTVTGLEMFVRQAATQFTHFTGHPAPMDTFRTVLRQRLGAGKE